MENNQVITENTDVQVDIVNIALTELQRQRKLSKLNEQAFSREHAMWIDGKEQGLQIAIDLLQELLQNQQQFK